MTSQISVTVQDDENDSREISFELIVRLEAEDPSCIFRVKMGSELFDIDMSHDSGRQAMEEIGKLTGTALRSARDVLQIRLEKSSEKILGAYSDREEVASAKRRAREPF